MVKDVREVPFSFVIKVKDSIDKRIKPYFITYGITIFFFVVFLSFLLKVRDKL